MELVPKTSENLRFLMRLSAPENFLELCINFSLYLAFSSFKMEEFEYSHKGIKA
jgi:hypothetical protein